MKKISEIALVLLLAAVFIPCFSAVLYPQDSAGEDEMSLTDGSQESSDRTLDLSGFIENENIFSVLTGQEINETIKKNEIRAKIRFQYGTERYYFYTVTDFYMLPSFINEEYIYSDKTSAGRNGRVSGSFFEVNPRELYFTASYEKFRIRTGNQIYGWGTADAFNPTSYFNPYDLRELLFKDEDELKGGVPSLSSMIFLGSFTLELVFLPVHIPGQFAAEGNFWALHYMEGPFPVFVGESKDRDISTANSGYGGRLGGTVSGIDFSVSGYHGPDREPLMRPMRTVLVPNEPVSIEVTPEYYNVTYVGADFSMKFEKFTIQGEVSFSPDKTVVVDQHYDINMEMPFEITETKSLSYAAGFNYYIPVSSIIEGHEGTAVFTAEWMQTVYYKNGAMKPLLTDIISCRVEDSYLDDRLKPSVTLVYDTSVKGVAVMPRVSWSFLNGFSIELSYCYIEGEKGSVIGYYRDNDFISVRGRYEF